MILNNEKKNLSRNSRRRGERKIEMDGNIKLLVNKLKTPKKEKNEKFDEIKELEIELVKIIYANNLNK